jgi:spermidine synthase
MITYTALFLLSAATLAFEITLTRVFSVAQFYHFAFMVVSLALLGFGASGTLLALFPRLKERDPARTLPLLSWGFALSAIGSYALTLILPFDSFRIALDWRQGAVLALHYVALAVPFFCSGAATGLLLAAHPEKANRTYAANLTGSALGCLLAVAAPALVGGEGAILLSAALAILSALTLQHRPISNRSTETSASSVEPRSRRSLQSLLPRIAQLALIATLILTAVNTPQWLQIRLSPYKSLSYALLLPDAELVSRRWNGFSRVDVVRSQAIRSLPGRGFLCPDLPPPQLGLTVDGDDLSPISHVAPGVADLAFTDCLLLALPYRLRPEARTLVLEPRGGFDVLVALAEGAREVTAVEANPLIAEAVQDQGQWAGNLYRDPRVTVELEEGRAYARRTREKYDVVALSLTTPQRTVTSGAYSLSEDYRYTMEAFADYVARLDENGLLVVTRWLQVPPSESIRAFALAVETIERNGGDPATSVVALRSYQQMLILVRQGSFTSEELEAIRAFAAPRAFDLVYLPGIHPDEVNRYNVMQEPVYYRACVGLLEAEDRATWYRDYSFDVEPPTDDRPFFGHFFKWSQAPEVLAMAGHTWQPFGGAGYFVLLALLVLAMVAAGTLILLPLVARGRRETGREKQAGAMLGYFALLGLGYLCVEIPLLQRFILFLGHPAYAMATVLFALLLFSGLGSLLSHRASLGAVLILLPALIGGYALGLPTLFDAALAAPLAVRLLITVVALAPPGLLMGMPFPKGMALLEQKAPTLIAWAWGVNGALSVVASILAALLALSFGFSTVLVVGAICYVGAWIVVLPPPGGRHRHDIARFPAAGRDPGRRKDHSTPGSNPV